MLNQQIIISTFKLFHGNPHREFRKENNFKPKSTLANSLPKSMYFVFFSGKMEFS